MDVKLLRKQREANRPNAPRHGLDHQRVLLSCAAFGGAQRSALARAGGLHAPISAFGRISARPGKFQHTVTGFSRALHHCSTICLCKKDRPCAARLGPPTRRLSRAKPGPRRSVLSVAHDRVAAGSRGEVHVRFHPHRRLQRHCDAIATPCNACNPINAMSCGFRYNAHAALRPKA
jgi:hypothetical protein